mmetsp:Transcript_14441/g.22391  ORF Transcript_14441/g.22391 Transcript_14441/m.22391 type:complete len:297 (-) Transcript_14441:30-920(-)
MELGLGPGVLGGGPGAVSLDGDVVGASHDSEKTVLTPVGSPGVSDGPELLAVFNTPSDDGDIVDDVDVAGGVLVDTSGVVLEGVGHGDTASDGASLVDFLHHLVLTSDLTVLLGSVDLVLVGGEAVLLARGAVLAHDDGGALLTVIVASGSVDGASLIGDVVAVHPLEGVVGLATVAAIILGAGDEDLGGDVDIGPLGVSGDLNSIGESGGGGVSPAGSAVGGDVLVSQVSEVVGAVHVVPDPLVGEVVDGLEGSLDESFLRSGGGSSAGVDGVNELEGSGVANEEGNGESDLVHF